MRMPKKYITINNETKCLKDWADFYKCDIKRIYRINEKYGTDAVVQEFLKPNSDKTINPRAPKYKITVDGLTGTPIEWSEYMGFSSSYLYSVIYRKGLSEAQKRVELYINDKLPVTTHPSAKTITVNGKTLTPYQWSKEIGCSPSYISTIIKQKGYDEGVKFVENHIVGKQKINYTLHSVTVDGETKPASEWDKLLGCRSGCIREKIKRQGNAAAVNFIKSKIASI